MFDRYEKQILFKPIGKIGQQSLANSSICIIGVGALGTNIANLLVRAGIGKIKLIDPDKVELSNLQRQTLFSENDISFYKAEVATNKLRAINSTININFEKVFITSQNIHEQLNGVDIIFDATDNFESRFIINNFCLSKKIPWIHSGVTASSGQSIIFIPGITACYQCLIQDKPEDKYFPSVNNSGIIASIVAIISSISVSTGIKFIIDHKVDFSLKYYDAWNHNFHKFDINRNEACKACCNT